MNTEDANGGPKGHDRCAHCGQRTHPAQTYRHHGEVLCADCCIETRSPVTRKTHWQYIGSIKGDYLKFGRPTDHDPESERR